jgi:hypothetical protein
VATDENKTYRWDAGTTAYVSVGGGNDSAVQAIKSSNGDTLPMDSDNAVSLRAFTPQSESIENATMVGENQFEFSSQIDSGTPVAVTINDGYSGQCILTNDKGSVEYSEAENITSGEQSLTFTPNQSISEGQILTVQAYPLGSGQPALQVVSASVTRTTPSKSGEMTEPIYEGLQPKATDAQQAALDSGVTSDSVGKANSALQSSTLNYANDGINILPISHGGTGSDIGLVNRAQADKYDASKYTSWVSLIKAIIPAANRVYSGVIHVNNTGGAFNSYSDNPIDWIDYAEEQSVHIYVGQLYKDTGTGVIYCDYILHREDGCLWACGISKDVVTWGNRNFLPVTLSASKAGQLLRLNTAGTDLETVTLYTHHIKLTATYNNPALGSVSMVLRLTIVNFDATEIATDVLLASALPDGVEVDVSGAAAGSSITYIKAASGELNSIGIANAVGDAETVATFADNITGVVITDNVVPVV